MNRVIEDGVELHNVTVEIVHGVATVRPNKSDGPIANSGGGPGEPPPPPPKK